MYELRRCRSVASRHQMVRKMWRLCVAFSYRKEAQVTRKEPANASSREYFANDSRQFTVEIPSASIPCSQCCQLFFPNLNEGGLARRKTKMIRFRRTKPMQLWLTLYWFRPCSYQYVFFTSPSTPTPYMTQQRP